MYVHPYIDQLSNSIDNIGQYEAILTICLIECGGYGTTVTFLIMMYFSTAYILVHCNNPAMINILVLFQQHSHVPLIVMINSTVKTISVRHAVTISGKIPMNTLLLLMCWWQLYTVLEFSVVLLFW